MVGNGKFSPEEIKSLRDTVKVFGGGNRPVVMIYVLDDGDVEIAACSTSDFSHVQTMVLLGQILRVALPQLENLESQLNLVSLPTRGNA